MKILIIGAGGMLGHKLFQSCQRNHDVVGTVRSPKVPMLGVGRDSPASLITGIDISNIEDVRAVVASTRCDVVVNCAGVVKQVPAGKDPIECIRVNALFPHLLAEICNQSKVRLIHVSTDCVFTGERGMYTEKDIPDSRDLYGVTKSLGEIQCEGAVTLRTSIIGRELVGSHGLVEWFLQSRARRFDGFRNAVFSGVTTTEFARIALRIIEDFSSLSGLYHLSGEPISKLDLLSLIARTYKINRPIIPVDEPVIDRSLDSTLLRTVLNYSPPSWSDMIHEMASDSHAYTAPASF